MATHKKQSVEERLANFGGVRGTTRVTGWCYLCTSAHRAAQPCADGEWRLMELLEAARGHSETALAEDAA